MSHSPKEVLKEFKQSLIEGLEDVEKCIGKEEYKSAFKRIKYIKENLDFDLEEIENILEAK